MDLFGGPEASPAAGASLGTGPATTATGTAAAGGSSAAPSGAKAEAEAEWAPLDLFSEEAVQVLGPGPESVTAAGTADNAGAGTAGGQPAAAAAAAAVAPAAVPRGPTGKHAKLLRNTAPPPSRGGAAGAAASAADAKQPKALLSQTCQKRGWQQPRFERLPDGLGQPGKAEVGVTSTAGWSGVCEQVWLQGCQTWTL